MTGAQIDRIQKTLLAAGIAGWAGEAALEPGSTQWPQVVDEALRMAQAVVVFRSLEARASEWVTIEISRAKRLRRRIFPLLVRGNTDGAVPLLLELMALIDLRVGFADGAQEWLIPALRQHLAAIR